MNKMDRLHKASSDKPEDLSLSRKLPSQAPVRTIWCAVFPSRGLNDRRGVTEFWFVSRAKKSVPDMPDQWQPKRRTLEQIAQSGHCSLNLPCPFATEFLPKVLRAAQKMLRTWIVSFFKIRKTSSGNTNNRIGLHMKELRQVSKFTKTSREQVSDALNNIHDTDWWVMEVMPLR